MLGEPSPSPSPSLSPSPQRDSNDGNKFRRLSKKQKHRVEVGAGGAETAQKELGQELFGEEGEEGEGAEEAAPAVREKEINDDEEEMDDFIDYGDGEKPRPRAEGVRRGAADAIQTHC